MEFTTDGDPSDERIFIMRANEPRKKVIIPGQMRPDLQKQTLSEIRQQRGMRRLFAVTQKSTSGMSMGK